MKKHGKKIFIVGPIGDFGGREVEVNIIARSLENIHDVTILSTAFFTGSSFSLQNLNNTKYTSLDKLVYENNIYIRLSSILSYLKNGRKKIEFSYANNAFSKKIFRYDRRRKEMLYKKLEDSELVILTMQLTSNFFSEIIEFCHHKRIPVIVRTTGTINFIPPNTDNVLQKVSLFLFHSIDNAQSLPSNLNLPFKVIDQCALEEEKLLNIPFEISHPLRFGFIGRFAPEKNILFLLDFFSNSKLKLIVAGNGIQKKTVIGKISSAKNCIYEGKIPHAYIAEFFKKIDVLIIASKEESGPLVGLEAMAAGKLIISTRVGAMVERLRGTSNQFWFEVNDPKTLEGQINELNQMNFNEIAKIQQELRKHYLDNYCNKIISNQYLEIIDFYC